MKLVDHFTAFLKDTVNLNATRLEQLETSVEALKDVIREADWDAPLITFEPQGSWAHRTIIKPVEDKVFDADLLVIVEAVEGWDACEYLSTLRSLFANHGTYEDKVRRFSHCVTIEYKGERRVDLAPCVRDRNGVAGHEVCNFNSNEFERSEPEPYTAWVQERKDWTGGNGLTKVTRLLKYLRDIKGNFSCPSVLLTTLLGMQISRDDESAEEPFEDVPTALKTIVDRLDAWLQARPTKPVVANPVLPSEFFSELWDDAQYGNFREKIHLYRGWIDDAFDESDRDESIGKWRRVFGDDFASAAVLEKAARMTHDARELVLAQRADLALRPGDDLVALLSRFGTASLAPQMSRLFTRLPHKQRPQWRTSAAHARFDLIVSATLHESKGGPKIADVPSGTPLRKGQWLRFSVRLAAGSNFGGDYAVHWRITNTDREAQKAGCMRGGFERANDGTSHWEALAYRGVHTAEAFVVRRRDNTLMGQSAPFYVVIE
jgi:hypothetical protein